MRGEAQRASRSHTDTTPHAAREHVARGVAWSLDSDTAGAVLVRRQCERAKIKASGIGYQMIKHNPVAFINAASKMGARAPRFQHLVLVDPVDKDDFSTAARLVAVLLGTHRADPLRFEKQGTRDALKHTSRYQKAASTLRFIWVDVSSQ